MTTLYRLVTVDEAKDQLSILDDEDNARVNRLVLDASQIVMNYLKSSPALAGWCDTSGLPLVDANGDPQRVGATGTLNTAGDFILTLDSNGDPVNDGISIIPGPVRVATLLIIAALDAEREAIGRPGVPQEWLDPISPAVESVLMRYRDPALA